MSLPQEGCEMVNGISSSSIYSVAKLGASGFARAVWKSALRAVATEL